MSRKSIHVIAGDGIGPEVVSAARPVIERAASAGGLDLDWRELPYGAQHYLDSGETLPEEAFEDIRSNADAILVGALGDPRVPGNEHARDILLGLRFKLDLFINFRPARLLDPRLCPLRNIDSSRPLDIVIFRENTEGSYLGRGSSSKVGTPDEEQISEEVNTAGKVTRIVRAAFEWATANGKTRVTMSDKSNAIPGHRLWKRIMEEVSSDYPAIKWDHRYVDIMAAELVADPQAYQVIVTNNLFGDILSDLAAQLVGGMGVAASANLHPGKVGLFESVHGSAPDIAGKGVANPMATILSGALMLHELGSADSARDLEDAVGQAMREGITTPDLGGRLTTSEVATWIGNALPN